MRDYGGDRPAPYPLPLPALRAGPLPLPPGRGNLRASRVVLLYPLGAAGELRQQGHRPRGPDHQIAAAVGAAPLQPGLRAIGAEGAFEAADARLAAVGRQVAITAFAVGAHLEHKPSDSV